MTTERSPPPLSPVVQPLAPSESEILLSVCDRYFDLPPDLRSKILTIITARNAKAGEVFSLQFDVQVEKAKAAENDVILFTVSLDVKEVKP